MASKNGARLLTEEVTRGDLAALVVLSERQIQRLTNQGVFALARNRQGRFVRAKYVLGRAVSGLHQAPTGNPLRAIRTRKPTRQSRARRMAAHAEAAELALQLQIGKLHRSEDLDFAFTRLLTGIKQRLLAMPSRLMYSLAGVTDPKRINEIVRVEVEMALTEASNFRMSDLITPADRAAHLGIDLATLDKMDRDREGRNGADED